MRTVSMLLPLIAAVLVPTAADAQTYRMRERMPGLAKASSTSTPTPAPTPTPTPTPTGYTCARGSSGYSLNSPKDFTLVTRSASQADAEAACTKGAGAVTLCMYYYANPPGQWFTYTATSASVVSGSNYLARCTPL